ncbi:MAG TPA: TonB-dependent receptor plug domain-containing protein [Candidatus Aquilonibacter sp.]|nr:TonB-dependent receptor plug domain-containing protein [Candidatus Aquilonibacter sp.]
MSSRRLFFPTSFLFIAVLAFVGVSFGQGNASLSGIVTDPSGGAVTGAIITAQPIHARGAGPSTKSAADGGFSLVLTPGRYRVSVSAQNFADVEKDFTLDAGSTEKFDVRLELASMSSNVIVGAEAEPEPAADVISPVDVLTRQDIDREQQIWLTSLLATAPGVAFSQLGPEGGVTSLFLDGGNSNYTRVMIDGVPEDVSLSGISIDLSDYTTDGIDKIEVIHGASSALYGSDAMTGAVDILTHRGSTTTPELVLQGQGGTFGTGTGNGQLSGAAGPFDYSAGASYFTTRGQSPGEYVLESYGPETYPYFRDTTLFGNFGWKFSDTDTLRLTLRNGTSDAGQQGQTLLAAESPYAVSPGEHSGLHNFSSGLSWDFATTEHWQTHIEGFDSRYQDTIDVPEYEYSAVDKFNRAGLDARSTYLFAHGGVTAGYYFENETGGALGRHDNAGYLEARYQITRRLTGVAGGRLEANDSFGTRFMPRVGAAYAARYGRGFWGDTRLRTSYGQGIKEPPLYPADCSPTLKPEQAATFDAGIDQYFDSNRAKVSATFFRNEFRNIVSFASGTMPNGMPPNCEAFGGSYFNTDKARAFGSDSSFELSVARWLNLGGTYSYDDSRVIESPYATDPALIPGNRLLKRPLNSANLFVNVRYRGADWNVTGYFVGRRTDSDFLSYEEDGVCYGPCITSDAGYVRWDTSAMVPLRYGVSLTAHFQNLFDKHYQDAVGYPALGYNYRVGVRYVWGGGR